jgi:hypothetical protein
LFVSDKVKVPGFGGHQSLATAINSIVPETRGGFAGMFTIEFELKAGRLEPVMLRMDNSAFLQGSVWNKADSIAAIILEIQELVGLSGEVKVDFADTITQSTLFSYGVALREVRSRLSEYKRGLGELAADTKTP